MSAVTISSLPAFRGYPAKRLLDLASAALLLMTLSPLFVLIAVAVKLTSRGPVFYRQRRLGLHERPFTIFKFRSMRADADRTGPQFTTSNDSRITLLGNVLRKTSLDELPQLFNVLRGEMSLLGPRPYAGFELNSWSAEERALRASVRPGMSGLSQVEGRSLLTEDQTRQHDLDYVRRCSFSLDCSIVLRTLKVLVTSRGTN
jgi:lipopolysaccharide/colanic/teichoic acid biosynthesis glycosyltransferase